MSVGPVVGTPLSTAAVGYLAPGIEMVIHAMRPLRDEQPDLAAVASAPDPLAS